MVTNPQDPRPRAFSYIRMSTDTQLRGDSLRRQMERSQKYADIHGLEMDREFDLHDIGKSGFTGENIASGNFGRFLTAVKEGVIPEGSYLLVESFDRLSRQEPIIALGPFTELVKAGIKLVTLDDERVFSGNISFEDLIISIAKMSRANEESVRKSDRLSQAWEAKRRSIGTKKLTARCPTWLRLLPDRSGFEVIEERAAIVRRIFDDAIAGLGVYSLVRQLNQEKVPTFTGKGAWQTSTVNKVISGKAVLGVLQPNKIVGGKRQPEGEPIADYYPRIISDEIFDAAQRARLTRKTAPSGDRKGSGGRKGGSYTNLFSKLAVCAWCKEPMRFVDKGKPPKGYSYLMCSSALLGNGCAQKSGWRYDQFEKAFLSLVEKLDLASLVSSEQQSGKRATLVAKLESAEGKQKRLSNELEVSFETHMRMQGSSDFLAKKIADYELQIAHAKDELNELRAEIAQVDSTALVYYGDKDRITDLIDQVRSTRGSSVYKLRAQIATRLQSLIHDLQLLIEDDDQQFEVNFRDGAHLMVFVDPANPSEILKIIRQKDDLWIATDRDGNELHRYSMEDGEY